MDFTGAIAPLVNTLIGQGVLGALVWFGITDLKRLLRENRDAQDRQSRAMMLLALTMAPTDAARAEARKIIAEIDAASIRARGDDA